MSNPGYILTSLAAGCALMVVIFVMRRHEDHMTRWRLALLTVAAILLAFQFVGLVGDLVLGDGALPAWTRMTEHLWILGFAAIHFAEPSEKWRHYTPWLGLVFLAIGALALATDIHRFTART